MPSEEFEWTWSVEYDDEGIHRTEDELGGFGAVELDRVTALHVYRHDGSGHKVVLLRDGMRPIFFRRKRKPINLDGEELGEAYVYATAYGWQRTVDGRNAKSLNWILGDGTVVATDRDIDDAFPM